MLTLLAAATATGEPDRLVLASTCAVYGEPDHQPIDETAPADAHQPYGSSKLAADRGAADYATATGTLGAISLRAFNITGATPGRPDHDVTRLIPECSPSNTAAHRRSSSTATAPPSATSSTSPTWPTPSPAPSTPANPAPGAAYNVGSGQPQSIHNVIHTVEAVTGRPVPRRHAPPAPEPTCLAADPTRIRAELGWQPTSSTLEKIISDAAAALIRD